MNWFSAAALVLAVAMILGLLAMVVWQGARTFWPGTLVRFEHTAGPALLGEIERQERFTPGEEFFAELEPPDRAAAQREAGAHQGTLARTLVRSGNFDLTGQHFQWVQAFQIQTRTIPRWGMLIERRAWGRFYGEPATLADGEQVLADEPSAIVAQLPQVLEQVRELQVRREAIEHGSLAEANRRLERERLRLRETELRQGAASPQFDGATKAYERAETDLSAAIAEGQEQIAQVDEQLARFVLKMKTADGAEAEIPLAEIVRAFCPNNLSRGDKFALYLSRWWEFLSDSPREANSEGGVFPAIFGTLVMTIGMSLAVAPFGCLAALYLREYAKSGWIVSLVRIAVNNLAGVPSIVFGVFGLGFFCYIVGGAIDQGFFSAALPNPTLGKGGLLWASLTLALLTLPVVIVASEEALAAVPNSLREGSYACGASKWQTIYRIVLPRALPGILTGMILAMARGAGEVAPLMLVGAVKLAPELPLDGVFPYIHPQRSFMHLGFHIYDQAFQSQNSEAARPMVFTTTLLLIGLIVVMNLVALRIRARLRARFQTSPF